MTIGTVTRLVVIKTFMYRGLPEEFSNGYAFKIGTPPDSASWDVLLGDVVRAEQKIFTPDVTYVRAYGYDSNDPKKPHIFAHTYPTDGTAPKGTWVSATGIPCSGDQAALVSFALDRKSDKGKPTYLRKYFHHAHLPPSGGDTLDSGYLSVLATFAAEIQTHGGGLTSPGGPKDTDPPPGGSVLVGGAGAHTYITTRTLKRRGKRPKTGN